MALCSRRPLGPSVATGATIRAEGPPGVSGAEGPQLHGLAVGSLIQRAYLIGDHRIGARRGRWTAMWANMALRSGAGRTKRRDRLR